MLLICIWTTDLHFLSNNVCLFFQFQTHKKQIAIIFESEQSTYYTMSTIYYVVISHNSLENIYHLTKNISMTLPRHKSDKIDKQPIL